MIGISEMPHSLTLVAALWMTLLPSRLDALTFDFTFTPTSTVQDIAGFNAAAAFWSSKLTDNVTIKMNVGTGALDIGVLASAGSADDPYLYSDIRNALAGEASSATDTSAVNSLAIGPSFGMLLNRTSNNPAGAGSATTYIDNDGGLNNSIIRMTTANAKALGAIYDSTHVDADITFSNAFAYDYDSSNGITTGSFDFVGIAIHEIGHSLGFTSGVDILDGNSTSPNFFPDNAFTYVTTLDLFRYSAASTASGVIDWTADNRTKYFSLDGGVTGLGNFSNGLTHGDGSQASHWKDNLGLGIMDPTAAPGETLVVTPLDLVAFDAIGWNLVPEPSVFLLGSLSVVFMVGRRRR